MTLHVELLMPDRSLWSGEAGLVIAKTIDGDIGVLAGHSPVFGILAPGSVVRIQPEADADGAADGTAEVQAAVRDGFVSVTADRVSILTSEGLLAADVDVQSAKSELDAAVSAAGSAGAAEESVEFRYARARLRATGEQA